VEIEDNIVTPYYYFTEFDGWKAADGVGAPVAR
jgi:hypothetical protein